MNSYRSCGPRGIRKEDDGTFMSGFTYLSAALYPWLYFLNLFWFHKMIKAATRFLSDEDGAESKKDAKNPQESLASYEEE